MIKTLGDVFSNRSKKSKSKSTIPRLFTDFYPDWIEILNSTLLPLLRRSIHQSSPSLLATHVSLLQNHFLTYFAALDAASSNDVAFLLSPPWRSSLEKPFLWLGDFHPFVFTNLLRSFLKTSSHSPDASYDSYSYVSLIKKDFTPDPWRVPSPTIVERLEEVERGLRLIVPEVAAREKDAHLVMARRLADDWVGGGKGVGEVMMEHVEEMMGILVHANSIRRSVLGDLVAVMDVYQAAMFFEGLAQFYVGFRDPKLLADFESCQVDLR